VVSDHENIDGVTEWDLIVERIRSLDDPERDQAQARREASIEDAAFAAGRRYERALAKNEVRIARVQTARQINADYANQKRSDVWQGLVLLAIVAVLGVTYIAFVGGGVVKTIALRGASGAGKFAIVDDEDFDRVDAHRWYFNPRGYVQRNMGGRVYDRKRTQLLHRFILGLESGDGKVADHRNHDTLDNRRSNLRVCTHAENQQNRRCGFGTSKYRGVHWDAARGKWFAHGRVNGQMKNLGRYADELDAARAAQQFRLEHMPFTVEEVIL
jgi:hypothetical protein